MGAGWWGAPRIYPPVASHVDALPSLLLLRRPSRRSLNRIDLSGSLPSQLGLLTMLQTL